MRGGTPASPRRLASPMVFPVWSRANHFALRGSGRPPGPSRSRNYRSGEVSRLLLRVFQLGDGRVAGFLEGTSLVVQLFDGVVGSADDRGLVGLRFGVHALTIGIESSLPFRHRLDALVVGIGALIRDCRGRTRILTGGRGRPLITLECTGVNGGGRQRREGGGGENTSQHAKPPKFD